MMPVIRIPDDVFRRLQRIATPLVDSPADVLERVLGFYESKNNIAPLATSTGDAETTPTDAGFETYQNHNNPHVTIHKVGCSQLRKHGGVHRHGQGSYRGHRSIDEARTYAVNTGLPVRECRFCNPSAR